MAIPNGWGNLGFTSGRRTYRGNKLVGGVGNSDHLRGTAADFTAPLSVLQAQFPGHRILNEGDHRHVSGLSDVPYYGNQGIAGLQNGVDTSAPKGQPMLQPRKPRPNFAGMSQPMGGMDPLGPMAMQQPMMPPQMPPEQQQQPNFAAMSQPAPSGHDPLAAKPGLFGKGGKGWMGLGILGDALSAYGGQRGVFAPFMMEQNQQEAEDNRFQQHLAAQQAMAIEKAKADALEPPPEVKLGNYIMSLSPDERAKTLRGLDAARPVTATGPMGTSIVPRSSEPPSRSLPDGSKAWLVNGEWYDNPEGR